VTAAHKRATLRRALPGVVSLVLFAAALVVLRRELHAVTGGYRRIFLNGGRRRPLRLPAPGCASSGEAA
jgi:hypothetical protein